MYQSEKEGATGNKSRFRKNHSSIDISVDYNNGGYNNMIDNIADTRNDNVTESTEFEVNLTATSNTEIPCNTFSRYQSVGSGSNNQTNDGIADSNDVNNTANTADNNHDTFTRYQGRFVRSSALNATPSTTSTQTTNGTLTGDQAKLFYESIVNADDSPLTDNTSSSTSRKRKKKKISKSKKKHIRAKKDDSDENNKHKISNSKNDDLDCNSTTSSITTTTTKPDTLNSIKKDIATLFRLCEGQHGANNLRELRAHLVRIASLSSSPCTVAPNDIECCTALGNDDNNSSLSSTRQRDNNPNIEYIKIINSSDQYGWTALMCAAASNNLNAVKLLIQEGARYTERTVVDKGGYTLRDICARNGATDVEKYLQSLEEADARKMNVCASNNAQVEICNEEMTVCETCGVTLRRSMLKKHETSMGHLLRDSSKTLPDQPYTIPEHNVGFQMMLRTGWEQQSGLGPDGSGRKKPIKTTLKLDKSGLGLNKTSERVSHFKARDVKAVGLRAHKDIVAVETDKIKKKRRTERSTTVAAASMKHEKQRSRFWERDMRRYMSTDD